MEELQREIDEGREAGVERLPATLCQPKKKTPGL